LCQNRDNCWFNDVDGEIVFYQAAVSKTVFITYPLAVNLPLAGVDKNVGQTATVQATVDCRRNVAAEPTPTQCICIVLAATLHHFGVVAPLPPSLAKLRA
jgi:hypothetical protein